ncbi:hypothetical protein CcaverHIS002_0200400 [Cutaneotrichosporon cavernicola]|uniref:Uncharacterized protein n=1 Tax=Cutaneotrichosporon cavernicola TaxID=279322 RepID=A0AA48I9I6_9TREE|nr:uncharacterized protein CcaverHIS019_0200440 [Cutaneotrichosporon cavernicola]BEI80880.1 hypothetical protein CcaverHIS002_0200400 [Cutaneotrichosporon cavernicola]BEI88682.1 hypothetical protein CcaverHIS019_0200440 [Cutaneotrichosporon cavernicola]BEI96455.1 hypothetical protein CcaverHIS631_0200440 [Cutaneotrichosporon cavernicola]BEJ04228.1 hypothetical protein CcaverHIS641_0200450 [Cutaneotrichosporon cavernicola]
MYVGHFATGLLLKALFPAVPSAPIIYGIAVLDLIDGIFTIVGINHVAPNLNAGPYLYFDLVFIDWDHSLAMALVLSLIWGLYFATRPAPPATTASTVGLVAFVASFSHWLCDLPFHNLDLAAYPYSLEHYGWGWWGRYLTGAWVMEGAFSAACLVLAAVLFARRDVTIKGPLVVCLVLFLNLSPWASPMYYIAQLPPPADYLVHGALVTLGFAAPAAIMIRMLDGAEDRARLTVGKKRL